MTPIPFLIVGGGIGGLATALGLARRGYWVTVLEREPRFTEIGAGLQLAPNAMRVLDKFGLSSKIGQLAWFPKRLVLNDIATATELTALNLGPEFRARYGFPYVVMHRGDLLEVLYQACLETGRVTLLSHQTVEAIEDGDEEVRVLCQDGAEYRARAVVAADGLWSRSRALLSDDVPMVADYVAYRGTLPTKEVAGDTHMDDVVMWIGENQHFVQYPVRRGELYNQVAVFKVPPFTSNPDKSDLDEAFRSACQPVRQAIGFMDKSRTWPMMDRGPIPRWARGRVALLGDAAHPMLQYIAQGACQAIEDAGYLASLAGQMGHDPVEMFLAYQTARVPRTARVQEAARDFGAIIHSGDPGAILLRDYVFKMPTSTIYEAVLDWLYGYNAVADW